ncbi:MAG: hypothetical protein ACRD26_05395 [Vicinamibacterales bacterium]
MSLRGFLAAIFLLGSIGLAAELVLVGHIEDRLQQVPLVLLAAGVVTLGWDAARRNAWSLWMLRAAALLLVAGGLAGLVLHYESNVEFELEMYPDLAGWPLVREALSGAIPALAPGALIQLGLIGLAYAYQETTR